MRSPEKAEIRAKRAWGHKSCLCNGKILTFAPGFFGFLHFKEKEHASECACALAQPRQWNSALAVWKHLLHSTSQKNWAYAAFTCAFSSSSKACAQSPASASVFKVSHASMISSHNTLGLWQSHIWAGTKHPGTQLVAGWATVEDASSSMNSLWRSSLSLRKSPSNPYRPKWGRRSHKPVLSTHQKPSRNIITKMRQKQQ